MTFVTDASFVNVAGMVDTIGVKSVMCVVSVVNA